ncbi:hypothetical protein MMC25_004160 [Agyrium rufum]|nr:hypothetical protein [Agyrium rufum]
MIETPDSSIDPALIALSTTPHHAIVATQGVLLREGSCQNHPRSPTHVLWHFKVIQLPQGQEIRLHHVSIEQLPASGEQYQTMIKCMERDGPEKAAKTVECVYTKLRSDLQPWVISQKCEELEHEYHSTWTPVVITVMTGKRRVPGALGRPSKQVTLTPSLFVMYAKKQDPLHAALLLSHALGCNHQEIESLPWDVPNPSRKYACFHCAREHQECATETLCHRCVENNVACIRRTVWDINVFAFGNEPEEKTVNLTRKRVRPSIDSSESSPSLLESIKDMPLDIDLPKPIYTLPEPDRPYAMHLAQLDRLYQRGLDAVYDGFLKHVRISMDWQKAQSFLFQARQPLYLLPESNSILINNLWIGDALNDKSAHIHRLRAIAGKHVLSDLGAKLERDRLAIIKQDESWCDNMLTYVLLVLKAALELDDSIPNSAQPIEIKHQFRQLQQALCFYLRELGTAVFCEHSLFLLQLTAKLGSVWVSEDIWTVLSFERARKEARCVACEPAEIDGSPGPYKIDVTADPNRRRSMISSSSSDESYPKLQRTVAGRKTPKVTPRKARFRISLQENLKDWFPFRSKDFNHPVMESRVNAIDDEFGLTEPPRVDQDTVGLLAQSRPIDSQRCK